MPFGGLNSKIDFATMILSRRKWCFREHLAERKIILRDCLAFRTTIEQRFSQEITEELCAE